MRISHARVRAAHALAAAVVTRPRDTPRPWLARLGAIALHPWLGHALTLAILWLMYLLVGVVGAQWAVDLLEDGLFGRLINPVATRLVHALIPLGAIQDLLVGPYGLITMALTYALAIVLPIVGVFFLCFGILEDSGYLPRLAVMMDRACRLVGLNGKAVVPLVLGLGCGSMAVMTARTLDTPRDRRLVTLLLTLAVPCSAQLGVIAAMLATAPPAVGWIWFAVVLGSFFAGGALASRLLRGPPSPFLYELPPLRLPMLANIASKTLGRVEWYLREAVPLFLAGTLLLFLLDRTGALVWLERAARPFVVSWLGLPPQATAALLVGFLRRDFGAAGFFAMQRAGELDAAQLTVSLVTITLFVPCVAQYLMVVKEQGGRAATALAAGVTAYAVLVGGVVRWIAAGLRI